jgi:hypothetical protein
MLMVFLEAAGYEVLDHNNNSALSHGTDANGGYIEYAGVRGHSDIVVRTPEGESILLEVKTATDRYYHAFMKHPDDERGYVSQLALYEECLGLPGYWVFFNKNTSEIGIQQLNNDQRTFALERANRIIPVLRDIETEGKWEALVSAVQGGLLQAPPPVPEVFRRSETGGFLVPQSMKFTKYRHCFYEITTEKNGYNKDTEYVINVRDTPRSPEDICLIGQLI